MRTGSIRSRHASAWTTFWQAQGPDSRCLALLDPETRRRVDAHWEAFASALPPAAKVLDLGAGAGTVGRSLLAKRPDLRITGVDAADVPPPSDPRLTLLPKTAMEALPFSPGRFEAAVSQFGLEYGDVGRAAPELARVLASGAPVSFLVHHRRSAIVREGARRRAALDRLLDERVRRAFLSAEGRALANHIGGARRAAPIDRLVAAVALALNKGVARDADARAAIWSNILAALAPERVLLGALEDACIAPEALPRWLGAFAAQFDLFEAEPLGAPSGAPVAWRISGSKAQGASTVSTALSRVFG